MMRNLHPTPSTMGSNPASKNWSTTIPRRPRLMRVQGTWMPQLAGVSHDVLVGATGETTV